MSDLTRPPLGNAFAFLTLFCLDRPLPFIASTRLGLDNEGSAPGPVTAIAPAIGCARRLAIKSTSTDPIRRKGLSGMNNTREEQYHLALEEILRIGTTPDTNAVGTLPGGKVGPLWSVGGKETAFEEMLRIAREALED